MNTVLFDAPGPTARIRHRALAGVGVVALAALVGYVGWRLADTGQFTGQKWTWLQYKQIQLDLVSAVAATLKAFALGSVLAVAFGAVFAAGRLSDHHAVRRTSVFVVELFRAVPLVILMFLFFYGLPVTGIKLTPYLAVALSLMLYNGAVLAEIFRGGVLALPKGQAEAGYALGLRKTQVMTTVLLPQALRSMLPTIISQLVVLLKDTALGFLILYPELLRYAQYIGGQGAFGRPYVPTTIVVAAIYIGMCLLLSALANYLERRTRRGPTALPIQRAPQPTLDTDATPAPTP